MKTKVYEKDLQELGDRLKACRNRRNLTLEEASQMTDVSQRRLTSLEHGRANITLIMAARICKGLGINPLLWLEGFWQAYFAKDGKETCPYGKRCCKGCRYR